MSVSTFNAPEAFEKLSKPGACHLEFVASSGLRKHLKAQRINVGERIRLIDGKGNFLHAELSEPVEQRNARLSLDVLEQGYEENSIKITLVQAISSAERMDISLRQACELGVFEIIPLMSQRSKVRLLPSDFEQKQQRWQRVAVAACEQSGRATIPALHRPATLEQALAILDQCDLLVCPWEEAESGSLSSAISTAQEAHKIPVKSAAVFVGPEGGFDISEVEAMQAGGAQTITLGSTILRTETASTVILALLIYALGGLGANA